MHKLMLYVVLFGSIANVAWANVIISGTRVVYPADQKVVAVELSNPDAIPSLVQAWIEYPNIENATQKVPFVITPNVGRVEPKAKQSLRIRQIGNTLPQDRESLFYLNVLDIPAKPKDAGQNYLQITLRNKLKFFYRPTNLPYDVSQAYDKVTWHWQGNKLLLKNPTPYYITYGGIVLKRQGKNIYDTTDIDMIAPFSQLEVGVSKKVKPDQVQWHIINDYGGNQSGISVVQ